MTEPNKSSDFEADQPSNNEVEQENNVNTEKREKNEKVEINRRNSSKVTVMKRQKGEAYPNRAGKLLIPATVVNFEERKKLLTRYYNRLNCENRKNELLVKGISCQVPSRRTEM